MMRYAFATVVCLFVVLILFLLGALVPQIVYVITHLLP